MSAAATLSSRRHGRSHLMGHSAISAVSAISRRSLGDLSAISRRSLGDLSDLGDFGYEDDGPFLLAGRRRRRARDPGRLLSLRGRARSRRSQRQVRDRGLLMISASFTYDGGHFSAASPNGTRCESSTTPARRSPAASPIIRARRRRASPGSAPHTSSPRWGSLRRTLSQSRMVPYGLITGYLHRMALRETPTSGRHSPATRLPPPNNNNKQVPRPHLSNMAGTTAQRT